ncbi:MAG TPA: putative toxin-antitoxin system toxin component, PIN family [Nitrospirae bacterium]|nr:putative toxin-antitoxin system toxin component, PIN family [Nitrospirota bacterium]
MRVVLDTNVIVSAFLNPFGPPARILRLILQGDIEIIFDERIIREYEIVLCRPKFKLFNEDVCSVIEVLRDTGFSAPAYNGSVDLPDKGDESFLEVALTSKADALVTGNKRHFPKDRCGGIRIVSPREFMELL